MLDAGVLVAGALVDGVDRLAVGKRRVAADEARVSIRMLERLGGDLPHRLGKPLIDPPMPADKGMSVLGIEDPDTIRGAVPDPGTCPRGPRAAVQK